MSNPPKLRQLERRETDVVLRWKDDSEHAVTYVEMRYWSVSYTHLSPRDRTRSRMPSSA